MAMVGARAASGQGMRAAERIAAELSAEGIGVVSGGALGIDAAAHRGVVRASGYTLSIMGCGLDAPYPIRNRQLFADILDAGGGLLSPFEDGCPPIRKNFVARNRIVAALAEMTIVVEAQPRSGSLHTARFAGRLGRKVAAIPGSPGCEALIARGAMPLSSGRDVIDYLHGRLQRAAIELPSPTSPEGELLRHLSLVRADDAPTLAICTGQALRLVQRRLLALEMRGLVLALPGYRYLLSPLASQARAGESGQD